MSDTTPGGQAKGGGPTLYRLTGREVGPGAWDDAIGRAAAYLRRGGLVAFPTETVYGLGADALQPDAVAEIFAVKGRPADNPLIVHVADPADLAPLVRRIPPAARTLIQSFWPGPLTLVMQRSRLVPDIVTAGLETVAVRMPDHPAALEFIERCQRPVAAPSANRSGRPSPTRGSDVAAELAHAPVMILDAGETEVGIESTVLDVTVEPPVVLRPGGLPVEDIAERLGVLPSHSDDHASSGEAVAPRSPGVRYRHYAPRPPVVLVEGDSPTQRQTRLASAARRWLQEEAGRRRIGVLCSDETVEAYPPDWSVISLGPTEEPASAARRLYTALRQLEAASVDVIFAEGVPEQGIGVAVMNRLKKAAAHANAGHSPESDRPRRT